LKFGSTQNPGHDKVALNKLQTTKSIKYKHFVLPKYYFSKGLNLNKTTYSDSHYFFRHERTH
jgi:hypothetical protein